MKVIGNLTKDAIIRAAVSEGLNVTQAVGTPVTFHADTTYANKVVYDSNAGKIVIVYTDGGNSNYPTAVVGTVNASNNSISFGSATVIETTGADTNRIGVGFDSSNNKIVVAYRDTTNSDKGRAAVGTVSGTSISFGTPVDFQASLVSQLTATFDSNENRFVIGYRDSSNSNYGTAIVGTVSGTSISFGTKVVFNSGNTTNLNTCVFDSSNNKVIFAYRDQGASQQITAVVGTVSGTSISFGSEVVVSSNSGTYPALAFDSVNNKVALAWNDQPSTNVAKCAIGTVSGTSISFGTAVEFDEVSAYFSGAFDANAGKVVFVYSDVGNGSKPTIASGTISGTSITFDTPVAIEDTQMNVISGCAYDSGNKKIVASYMDDGNSDHGDAVVFQASYTSATGGTIADGSAVIVNANGTVSTVSQSSASSGTVVQFESGTTAYMDSAYDTTNNKVVIVYTDNSNGFYGTAVVGTVSGESISFGTPVVYNSRSTAWNNVSFDENAGKVVVFYRDTGGTSDGKANVGTVSGTSISFGSQATLLSSQITGIESAYDSTAQKIVVIYKNNSNDYGEAKVSTISGTSVSFGSAATFISSGIANQSGIAYDSTNDKSVIAYRKNSDNKGVVKVGTVSGTSISFGSEVEYESGATESPQVVFDPVNNKINIFYVDGGNSDYLTGVIGTVSGTSISFTSPSVVYNAAGVTTVGVAYNTRSGNMVAFLRGASAYGLALPITSSSSSFTVGSSTTITTNSTSTCNASYASDQEKIVVSFSDGDDSSRGKAAVYTDAASTLTTENFVGFMDGAALDGTNGEILSSCSIARNQTSLTAGQTYFVSPTDGALSLTAGSPSVTAGTAISNTELIVKG